MNDKRALGSIDFLVVIMIMIEFLIFIIFFPQLEGPDNNYHYRNMMEGNVKNLYFNVLKNLMLWLQKNFHISFYHSFTKNTNWGFFNESTFLVQDGNNVLGISILQLMGLIIIFISILIFIKMINSSKKINCKEKTMFIRATFIYYLYPAVAYLITTITTDYMNYLYQPFFIYFIYSKKHIVNIVFMIFLYSQDTGIIINILFLVIYLFMNVLNKIVDKLNWKLIIIILFIFGMIIYFSTRNFFMNIQTEKNSILYISQLSITAHGKLYTKVVNIVLSSFLLWGVGSYVTCPLFYLIYVFMTVKIIKKSIKNLKKSRTARMYIIALVTVIYCIIAYPPYSNIRYYVSYIYILILAFFKYYMGDKHIIKNNKYSFVCVIFFIHNVLLVLLIYIYNFILK